MRAPNGFVRGNGSRRCSVQRRPRSGKRRRFDLSDPPLLAHVDVAALEQDAPEWSKPCLPVRFAPVPPFVTCDAGLLYICQLALSVGEFVIYFALCGELFVLGARSRYCVRCATDVHCVICAGQELHRGVRPRSAQGPGFCRPALYCRWPCVVGGC